MIDGFGINQPVTVGFYLKGRPWTRPTGETKWFKTLSAWDVQDNEHPGDRDERLERMGHMQGELSKLNQLSERDERGETFDDSDIPF